MKDQHLNLFYSYNRDNELIENNLTRAWIVTLRMLSAKNRSRFLQALLEEPLKTLGADLPSFTLPQFALQGHIDRKTLWSFKEKFIITIATFRDMNENGGIRASEDSGNSIPDAWIFDPDQGYCFLVEAKVGFNPLDAKQVYSHAKNWLNIPAKNIQRHILPLTWHDVLHAIPKINASVTNEQESLILLEFSQYLHFFGYKLFTGFDFSSLQDSPGFSLLHQYIGGLKFLDFSNLQDAPSFHIGNAKI